VLRPFDRTATFEEQIPGPAANIPAALLGIFPAPAGIHIQVNLVKSRRPGINRVSIQNIPVDTTRRDIDETDASTERR
jgi:hypothetical protein